MLSWNLKAYGLYVNENFNRFENLYWLWTWIQILMVTVEINSIECVRIEMWIQVCTKKKQSKKEHEYSASSANQVWFKLDNIHFDAADWKFMFIVFLLRFHEMNVFNTLLNTEGPDFYSQMLNRNEHFLGQDFIISKIIWKMFKENF